jgi:hypothetical protein
MRNDLPNEPYRQSEGSVDTGKLARLAEEGERRIHAASERRSQVARAEANDHLRVAIGAVRGSPRARALIVLTVLGALMIVTGLALIVSAPLVAIGPWLVPVGIVMAFGSNMASAFAQPVASVAQLDAEHDWIAKLPFAFEGYFEALSTEPERFTRLQIELAWQGDGPDLPTLQGIVGLLDTDARVTSAPRDGDGATIMTGRVSGYTGITIDREPIYRNHEVAKYLHRLVDVVLLPVHHDRALSSVRVMRTSLGGKTL